MGVSALFKPYLPDNQTMQSRRLNYMILTLLSSLCVVHGASSALVENFPTLVASLIVCLSDAANQLYDSDTFSEAPYPDHDMLVIPHLICLTISPHSPRFYFAAWYKW